MHIRLVKTRLGTFVGQTNENRSSTEALFYPAIVEWQSFPIMGRVAGQVIGVHTQSIIIPWPSEQLNFIGDDPDEVYSIFDSEVDKENPFIKNYLKQMSETWKKDFSKTIIDS